MKFASYNVNGIRAIIKKNFELTFRNIDADVFSLNETKWSDDDPYSFPMEFDDYFLYFTNSKEKKGYSGVAVYSKVEPLGVHYGLGNGEYDNEGRIITLEFEGFYYVAAYVPNAGEELKRLPFRLEFEEKMRAYLMELDKKKPVVYAGDLNVAHEEIDIKNPKANEHNAGYTKEEREAMDKLLASGFTDVYRKLYPTKVEYSWWSYRFKAKERNAGWRIDYFLLSDRIVDKVRDASILTTIEGSDHCPITLSIDLPC